MVEHQRQGGAWTKFRELSEVLVGKQGIFISVVLNHFCCTVVKLTVVDEARLRGLERRMNRKICVVRLTDWVLSDVLHDRVGCED